MPRNYRPKNILTTDRTNLEKAFYHRVETGCSIRTACNLFGVKVSTLGDAFTRSTKESDGKTFVPKHENVKKVFTAAQEDSIETYAIKIARMFYGLPTRAFRTMVLKYAEAVGSPAIPDVWRKEGMATREWYYGYMFRHPKLALKAPEGMSLARAMAFNRVNVEVFFKAYVEAVEQHSFMPARIFNLDESGLSTVMKPCKVVCERGRPVASQVARERGSHMTFVGIVNAAGHGFPPVFIIAPKKMNADFLRGTTAGTTVLLQSNGWMDHECFVETLQHVHKVSYSSVENKILLIMDNAECHMSIHAVEYAIQHGIVIVTLPPHTTAKLQPLDVSVFGPFKTVLRSIQDDFKLSNPHVAITEHMLPEMACKAWGKVCNVTNITNGFRATGIYPINRNIFPDDAFAGAEVTEQALPDDDGLASRALASDLTPSSSELSSSDYQPDQPQPGSFGVGRMSPASSTSAASTPGAAPQTPTPTALTPEAVQPYPKAPPRPAARGRKKIRACILTEDEEALGQLREKEEKKAAREEKKCKLEEKRREKKRQKEAAKRRRAEDGSSSDEEAADNPAPVPLCDDSFEYSDEFAEELEPDAASYPFAQKEPEVCELHFAPEEIERETLLVNEKTGSVIKAKLRAARLRKGAVPSRIPQGCPTTTTTTTTPGPRKNARKEQEETGTGTQTGLEGSGAVPSRIPQGCPTTTTTTTTTTPGPRVTARPTGRKSARKEQEETETETQTGLERSDDGGDVVVVDDVVDVNALDNDDDDDDGDSDIFKEEFDCLQEDKAQFETISDLHKNTHCIDKYWKVIEVDSNSILICNITCHPNPKIKASVVIDESLAVKAYVDGAEMQTLGTYTVPTHVKDTHTLQELLKNLKRCDTNDRVTTPGRVLFLLQQVLSILTLLRDESSNYKNVLKGMCEQIRLMTMKKVEYSPEFLVFSSLLYSCSPHAYRLLRTMGHLILPCYSTVRSLSLSQNLTPVIEQHESRSYFLSYIKNKFNFLSTDDLTVALSVEEIQIKPFFDYKGCNSGLGSAFSTANIATSAYVFMVNSLRSKFKDVVHILPTRVIRPYTLFEYTRRIIIGLEQIGFKVICIVTDNNNTLNKKAMSNFTHPPILSIVYPHPSLPSRPLFLVFDAAHVLKSVQNSWLDQKDPDRTMKYPQFLFDDIEAKSSKLCSAPFVALRKLNDLEAQSHTGSIGEDDELTLTSVCPSDVERHDVNFVNGIFNRRVVDAVLDYGKKFCVPYYHELADYVRIMYSWWTIMNVDTTHTDRRMKHNYALPLTNDIYNEGYVFLHKFCDWLDTWDAMHIAGKLRKETLTALKHTTLVMISMTSYCTKELKMSHVMTAKFQTDKLEARFNKYRQLAGGNYNVSMRQVFEAERKLRQMNELKIPLQVTLGKQTVDLNDLEETEWDGIRADDTSNFNNLGVEITRDDIERSMRYLTSLTHLAGYCCYMVTKKNKCGPCKELLTCSEDVEDIPYTDTLHGMNGESLLYPDERVVSIVMYNYIVLDKLTEKFDPQQLLNQKNVIADVTMNILADNDVFLPISNCSNEHSIHRVQKMIIWASTNALLHNYREKQNNIILLTMNPRMKRKIDVVT